MLAVGRHAGCKLGQLVWRERDNTWVWLVGAWARLGFSLSNCNGRVLGRSRFDLEAVKQQAGWLENNWLTKNGWKIKAIVHKMSGLEGEITNELQVAGMYNVTRPGA